MIKGKNQFSQFCQDIPTLQNPCWLCDLNLLPLNYKINIDHPHYRQIYANFDQIVLLVSIFFTSSFPFMLIGTLTLWLHILDFGTLLIPIAITVCSSKFVQSYFRPIQI